MWGAVSWLSVWAGIAGGALASAVLYAAGSIATSWAGGSGAGVVLIISVLGGLLIGGWIAGRISSHSGRFHGSLAGLGLALVVLVVSRLGGSPATSGQVLLLALVAIAGGGVGGWLGGRHR
jgi:hypothetical protein